MQQNARVGGRLRSQPSWATCLAALLLFGAPPAVNGQSPVVESSPSGTHRATLDRYCVTCHNPRLKAAGLLLDRVDPGDPMADAATWEKVIRKLRSGAMPPAGSPRPEKSTLDSMVGWLTTTLDRAALAAPNPGRPALHRLNRSEYVNAVRDVLGVDIDGATLLPPDDAGYGFDNIGDVLTVTPALLERYLLAAKKIARVAVGDMTIRASAQTYGLPFSLVQDARMGDAFPFGTRGGLSVSHAFPVDGEYVITIELQRHSLALGSRVRGTNDLNVIDVLVDGERVQRLTVGRQGRVGTGERGAINAQFSAATDQRGQQGVVSGDGPLTARFAARAGTHTVTVTFIDAPWYMEGVGVSRLPAASDGYSAGTDSAQNFGKIQMSVDALSIAGPFNALASHDNPARRQVFICRPATASEELPCARRIVSHLARRAFRRPVTTKDVEMLMGFYRRGRAGGDLDSGVKAVIERILVSPAFLVRRESEPAGTRLGQAYRVSPVELASRLSFFLWSSVPDEELLTAASAGRLSTPVALERQVARMMADRKSNALMENFFGQWLTTKNVVALTPDPHEFPEFDGNLREAFAGETARFIESQVREDRPIPELLTANYTFVNERLARHYGMPNVYGTQFRRVVYPNDARAGLLGHGSVLLVTSYPNRTSVVQRGKWILEALLGTPPPPPPANVPPLPENDKTSKPRTLRERMEQHRKNPACAACHSRMDPLGFALENFNAVGGFRMNDAGNPIDPSGTFLGGAKFSTPAEFRTALLDHRDEFVETVAVKLLTYAMGRGVEPFDMPAVRSIVRTTAAKDYRWSALVSAIVRSLPFQMRRAES